MNRNRSIFSKTLIVSLAILLLLANVGISVRAHYCHGNLSQIVAYSEFGISNEILCNCKIEIKTSLPSNSGHTQLQKHTCCKNTYTFNKLHVESTVVMSQHFELIKYHAFSIIEFIKEESFEAVKKHIPSPPLIPSFSGKKLILFLSQLRIPAFIF